MCLIDALAASPTVFWDGIGCSARVRVVGTAHASATVTDAVLRRRLLGRVDAANRLGALPVGVTGVVVRCCC